MTEIFAWVERSFDFSFPVELYPNLRVRLRGTPARLEETTRDLAPADLTARRGDKWSIQEHVGHLGDLEGLWATRVEELLGGAETLTAADMSNRSTHEAGHNDRPLEELLSTFRRARGRLVARLDGLAPADFRRVARHPRLEAPMRLVDLMHFAAEHDDHHLARIWEMRRQLDTRGR